jgi:capsular exopolysaccharide synthesis family protein
MDDNQRLFARYRVILVAGIVLGVVVGVLVAVVPGARYAATASVQVQDLSQLEGIVGGTAPSSNVVAVDPAAIALGTATSDRALAVASRTVPGAGSTTTLRNQVSAAVDPASALLKITATTASAQRSAAVANAVAAATVALTNGRTRARFSVEARELQQQLASLPRTSGPRTADQQNVNRLNALAIVAQPATISQPAEVPTSAASRQVPFAGLLGGVIGLILVLVGASVRELLDRTVHAPTDLAERLGLPVLGHVEEATLGSAPFLAQQRSASERAAIARFGVLRKNVELMGADGPPRTVLVTSAGPAAGKTTVAASLAHAFAAAGRATVLLEADMRRPVLSERLPLRAAPGLAEYLAGSLELQEIVQHSVGIGAEADGGPPSLRCVVAGHGSRDPGELLASPRVGQALDGLLESNQVVVIDAPPIIPVPDAMELLTLVDAYLVCVRAGSTRLPELDAMRELLQRVPERPGGVVVTGVAKGRYELGGYADDYTASLGPTPSTAG